MKITFNMKQKIGNSLEEESSMSVEDVACFSVIKPAVDYMCDKIIEPVKHKHCDNKVDVYSCRKTGLVASVTSEILFCVTDEWDGMVEFEKDILELMKMNKEEIVVSIGSDKRLKMRRLYDRDGYIGFVADGYVD